jgi:pimeloyl-ACP methyl ester carboxylesterase
VRKLLKWILILIVVGLAAAVAFGWQSDTDATAMKAKYTNSASQFVDIGGGLFIHTRDEGKRDGPALVLIHGSNASLQTWEPWVKRLGGKYRIISLDLPGHGLTGANPSRDYHYAAFVDVVDKVMTKLAVQRFAIAGNSMGGGVAWHYALAHPERVWAVGLVDAAGAPAWQAKQVPLGFKLARMPVARDLMLHITPRFVIDRSLHQSMSNQAIINDAMIDRYWELLLFPGNRQATLDRFALRHNIEPASQAALKSLKVPVLIQWGEEDGLIPVSSARWFATSIPGAKTIIYPHVGHIPMEEVPDQSATDMDAFLSKAMTPAAPVQKR